MDVPHDSEIFRDLMRFKPAHLSANAWAVQAGVSRTVWADMRRHGNPSRRTLERLLAAAGSNLAEFEALRVGGVAQTEAGGGAAIAEVALDWGGAPHGDLPLVASGKGSSSVTELAVLELQPSRIVRRIARPLSLAHDREAFALEIMDDAMWPRFRPGQKIALSPRLPIADGNEVLIQLHATGKAQQAIIAHLVSRSAAAIELRQFNPDRSERLAMSQVAALVRIVGELI